MFWERESCTSGAGERYSGEREIAMARQCMGERRRYGRERESELQTQPKLGLQIVSAELGMQFQ